jgi:hypothetical protein
MIFRDLRSNKFALFGSFAHTAKARGLKKILERKIRMKKLKKKPARRKNIFLPFGMKFTPNNAS